MKEEENVALTDQTDSISSQTEALDSGEQYNMTQAPQYNVTSDCDTLTALLLRAGKITWIMQW